MFDDKFTLTCFMNKNKKEYKKLMKEKAQGFKLKVNI